ncbi:MAG: CoA transferase [Alphaproteobacteria bacterium]|nr:CoA transferase [Alphaproteobacteria bacterium]
MAVSGPLRGLTVVDLTRVLAGPYCTMMLAELGARILKVEPPDGDDARRFGPFLGKTSVYFASLNRGKESIALDLKKEEEKEIFLALLDQADVLVENYRAGTMERLGLGWETLHERFPRLIYAATSGFGHSGPYAHRPAYDMVAQAMGGIMSLTGQPGGPPTRVGSSIGDIAAGLFTTIGIEAALLHREQTGEGMKVDVAMLDSQVAILENAIGRYVATQEVPGPLGAHHPSIAPFGAFRAADDHLIVACANEATFGRLCEALERPELATDARFKDNIARVKNVEALKEEIESVLDGRTKDEWLRLLENADVPCSPINNVEDVLNDPQVLARNMVIEIANPDAGSFRAAGNPIKLSAYPESPTRAAAPELDADRARIVRKDGD